MPHQFIHCVINGPVISFKMLHKYTNSSHPLYSIYITKGKMDKDTTNEQESKLTVVLYYSQVSRIYCQELLNQQEFTIPRVRDYPRT